MSRFDWLRKERYFECYDLIGLKMMRTDIRAVRTIKQTQEKIVLRISMRFNVRMIGQMM